MELFGIGTTELIAILIIMMVVAGPKRMIRWAYILGQYVAKLRRMWAETMAVVQNEFDAAGMDITVPKTITTRNSLVSQMNNALSGMTRPVQDALDEVKTEVYDDPTALTASASQKVET
jgi:Sec-independent protein translocase protein TatA